MPLLSPQEREQRLDEVIASYLQALREGNAPARQELLDAHPELADELSAFFADQDRFDRMAAPLRAMMPAGPALPTVRNFGDYEILEEIARGGMGVVFKARQQSLGRVVALKMLLAGPWASAADLQRFRSEAEAAAQLDHPHIVPIYEVGTHDGHPYLSMKLVEGGSLAQRLASAGRPAPRAAARLLVALADAVHYAHERGILHRDLKPANVLLASGGRKPPVDEATEGSRPPLALDDCVPMLADFGLAKRGVRPGRADAFSVAATLPLPPALTHTGAIVGTPGYMAPEQAAGEPSGITTAADVYGLGAILYELLTGRPPFRGASPLETVRQVIEQEPAAPRAVAPDVDRDLETICLKCLHKEPARRYASARELADDLRRYLDGEPILARPVGPLARTWRLARRKPAVALLTLALAAAVVVGLSSVTALWLLAEDRRVQAEDHARTVERQRDEVALAWQEEGKARREAEEHLRDSERSFHMAHKAVHDYCRRVSDELRDASNLQPLRKALLQDALAYYQDFVARRGDDPALRRELADTYQSKAHVTKATGDRAEARDDFEKARDLYRGLLREDPNNLELQQKLASTLNSLATLYENSDEAYARFREAYETYNRFLEAHPEDRALRGGLSQTLNNLGAICARTGRREARDWFEKALTLGERLAEEEPHDLRAASELANTLSNYAVLRGQETDGRDDALKALGRARDLRQKLSRARPRDPRAAADLASSDLALGIAQRDAGQLDDALKTFRQAHALNKKVAAANPFETRYRIALAAVEINLGVLLSRKGDKAEALRHYEEARRLQEPVVKLDPGNLAYRRELGMTYYNLGTLQGALNHRPEEHQELTRAREIQAGLVQADPANIDFRIDLSRTLNNLAWNRLAAGRAADVPPLMQEAIGHARYAVERAPKVLAYRKLLNANYGTLGEAAARAGHTRAAADALRQRVELWPDNADELFRVARELCVVAGRVGHGKPELTAAERDERRRDLDEVLALLRRAAALGFRDAARLRQDRAFAPLRDNDVFENFIRELEKQAQKSPN